MTPGTATFSARGDSAVTGAAPGRRLLLIEDEPGIADFVTAALPPGWSDSLRKPFAVRDLLGLVRVMLSAVGRENFRPPGVRVFPGGAMTAIGVDTAPSRSGVLSALYDWPLRRWVAAVVAAVVIAVFVGVPTGLVPTPIYHRMTPTTWWDYAVWAASATVAGLTLATYVRGSAVRSGQTREKFAERSLAATIVSGLAVGCPICNKVVVALVGISGALNYWAPLQPVIGVLSVALLSAGLFIRLRGEIACPVPGS